MLYRAPENVGPPNEWDGDNFIRLGALASFQAELALEIDNLALDDVADADMAAGEGQYNGLPVLVTVHLDPDSGDVMWFGLANCVDASLLERLKRRFGVRAFDYESCEFI
ncbi:hypothetical protein GCM10027343_03020 [Noviherbaspirillum agri]